jgi:hypothetical protein
MVGFSRGGFCIRVAAPQLFLVAVLASLGAIASASHHRHERDITGYQRACGPMGNLRLNRPKLVWQVWPGDGCKITHYHMSINDRLVNAEYDPAGRQIVYRPDASLPEGTYNVQCEVLIDDELQMKKHWKFSVTGDATATLPSITDDQVKLAEVVNQYRDLLGLEHVVSDPALSAAAQNHAQYMKDSGHVDHEEAYAVKSWFGYTLEDRLYCYGYVGGAAEDVGYLTAKSSADTIKALFDAPYHRISFMQPGQIGLGAGNVDGRVALDFELNLNQGVTLSPVNGQTHVPSSWNGFESPCPLRMHGGQAVCGYPILVAGFGPKDNKITDGSVTLTGPLGNVECYLNTPGNDDHLSSSLLLIPVKPLMDGTYQASAHVIFGNGTDRTIQWSFTVGS